MYYGSDQVHPYIKRNYGQRTYEDIEKQANDLTSAANSMVDPIEEDKTDSSFTPVEATDKEVNKAMAKGAQRGMSGGVGSAAFGAGLSGALTAGALTAGTGGAMGAGLLLMKAEQDAQARNAEEDAKAVEAQNRKQAQLAAINTLIGVSKGLSVTG